MINAFVFGTNTLISAHLLLGSVSRRAYDRAFEKRYANIFELNAKISALLVKSS